MWKNTRPTQQKNGALCWYDNTQSTLEQKKNGSFKSRNSSNAGPRAKRLWPNGAMTPIFTFLIQPNEERMVEKNILFSSKTYLCCKLLTRGFSYSEWRWLRKDLRTRWNIKNDVKHKIETWLQGRVGVGCRPVRHSFLRVFNFISSCLMIITICLPPVLLRAVCFVLAMLL